MKHRLNDKRFIAYTIDQLIELLDQLDGDPDLELAVDDVGCDDCERERVDEEVLQPWEVEIHPLDRSA